MRFLNHLFLDGDHSVCYVYIRKNACSAFKQLIVAGLPDPERSDRRLEMRRIIQLRGADRKGALNAEKRIFVIRDPLERVASGFLSQVVLKLGTPYPEMYDGIEAATGQARHEVTFESFVDRYLCGRDWKDINPHFLPMRNHLSDIVYTDVLHDRTLREDVGLVLGEEAAERHFARPVYSTSRFPTWNEEGMDRLTTGRIAAVMAENRRLPGKEALLGPALRERLLERYAMDVRLYADYLSARQANGDRPPAMDMRND